MFEYQNLTEAVAARCAERPDHPALVLVGEGEQGAGWGTGVRRVGYGELDRDARRVAAWLQDRYTPGERVLIQQRDPRLFAVSLLACLYSGLAAVPAPPPPAAAGNVVRRVVAEVRDAAACVVLTDARDAGSVSTLLAMHGYGHVECAPIDGLLASAIAPEASAWRMPDLRPDAIALLQYTSGSTKIPRGVVIEHRQLAANQEAIRRTVGTGPDSVLGGWLPLHHDMGLIGQLLHPLWLGATSVLMTPDAFVRDPGRWLRLISDHGIEVSGGPDFGYRLCVERAEDEPLFEARLDLARWRVGIVGGEPVRASTLRDFHARFGQYGLRPTTLRAAYGLAEATLLVSCAEPAAAARTLTVDRAALERGRVRPAARNLPSRTLVGCGPARGLDVRIVNPDTGSPAQEDRVGEIWLRGASIGSDYWRRPPGTTETFHGRVDGGLAEYLRTGDLGLVHDGQLYVTGRRSELIIVAGRNLHPLDLEQSVQEVSSAFGPGAAFGVQPGDEPEQVVIVQEVRGRARSEQGRDLEELATAVRTRVAADFAVHAGGVVLVRPGTVRRTTSGKLERAAVRKLYLGGRIEALYELVDPPVRALVADRAPRWAAGARTAADPMSTAVLARMSSAQRETALRGWLGNQLGRHLRHAAIAHDTTLFEVGLDSVAALGLIGDIEARFDLRLPPTVAFDHPTIADLAAHLGERLEAAHGERPEHGPEAGCERPDPGENPSFFERSRS